MTTEENQHTAPPVESMTPQNVPVHMAYMRRDLDSLTRNFETSSKEQTTLLKEIRDNSPSRKEFEELRGHVDGKASNADFDKLEKFVKDNMITKADFEPVKKVVYGAVVIILSSVMVALVALVIVKGN